jgi:hypothetical protein
MPVGMAAAVGATVETGAVGPAVDVGAEVAAAVDIAVDAAVALGETAGAVIVAAAVTAPVTEVAVPAPTAVLSVAAAVGDCPVEPWVGAEVEAGADVGLAPPPQAHRICASASIIAAVHTRLACGFTCSHPFPARRAGAAAYPRSIAFRVAV